MSNQKSEKERRQFQRITFIAEVHIQLDEQKWNCALEDISLKGMLIQLPYGIEAELDKIYAVELVLAKDVSINMDAKISHTTENHWGLQWQNIDLDGLIHLRRLLELNFDDPEEMHRELAELG